MITDFAFVLPMSPFIRKYIVTDIHDMKCQVCHLSKRYLFCVYVVKETVA